MFDFNVPPFTWLSNFGYIGLPMLLFGFLGFINALLFALTSKKTKGIVTAFTSSRGSKGGTVYHPVYTFTTEDGQELTQEDKLGSNPPAFIVGQEVQVLYSPRNPQSAKIKTFSGLYFTPSILFFTGAVFLGIDILQMIAKSGNGAFQSILQFLGFGS